ncbi:MAG: hypothetical protein ACPGQL_04405 [Thermoplasmatota archaeon]
MKTTIMVVGLLVLAGVGGANASPLEPMEAPRGGPGVQGLLQQLLGGSGGPGDLDGSCIPPSPVRDLVVTPVANGNRLDWKAPVAPGDSPIRAYKVFRIDALDPASGYQVFHVSAGSRSYLDTDTDRQPLTIPTGPSTDPNMEGGLEGVFVYLVAAKNDCGLGGFSNPELVIAGFNPLLMAWKAKGGPWPHCLILTVIYPVAPPYVNGPHLECLLPLPI